MKSTAQSQYSISIIATTSRFRSRACARTRQRSGHLSPRSSRVRIRRRGGRCVHQRLRLSEARIPLGMSRATIQIPFFPYEPPVDTELARQMANSMGAEIAKRGYRLLVYDSDNKFIEGEAVSDFVKTGKARPASSW